MEQGHSGMDGMWITEQWTKTGEGHESPGSADIPVRRMRMRQWDTE